ncbi:MAG: M50 family peptidase [Hymenobacter sp.]|nr:MAG: M50 family peptidase [Hymenobacter sp.]
MKKLGKLLGVGLLGLLGVWVGGLLHGSRTHTPTPTTWPIGHAVGQLGLLLLVALLAIGVHELGHAVLGHWQGFEFQWLTVGPFRWQREAQQIRFRWNTSLYAAGGLVVSIPLGDHHLRRRYLLFAAGGPLASVLLAGVTLSSYALLSAQGFSQSIGFGLVLTGAVSGAIALVTLLPLHLGGVASDGARLLTLWRGGPASQLELAVLTATSHSVAGTRPRQLPLTALQAALTLPDTLPFKPYLYHYLYLAALDSGHLEQAAHYLTTYRERVPQLPALLQETVWLEAAFFAAAFTQNLSTSQAFQQQAVASALTPADIAFRVAAAQARLLGDAPQVRAHAQASLRALTHNMDRGSSVFYAEWLHETLHWASEHGA